jgi:ABC-type multidrug transport system fused ATPase/permease subunit
VLIFFKDLNRLFEPQDRRRMLGVFLMMGVQSALEMVSIAVVLPVIDIALNPARLEKYGPLAAGLRAMGIADPAQVVLALSCGLVTIFIGKNLALLAVLWWLNSTVQTLQYGFRARLLAGYLRQPFQWILRQNSATVMRNLFSSAASVFAGGVTGMFTVVLESLMVVGVGGVLLWVEPVATLVAAAIVGTVAGVYLVATRRHVVTWGRRVDFLLGHMMRMVNEALATLKEVKLRHCEEHFVGAYRDAGMEVAVTRVRLAMNGVAPRPVGEIILVVAVVAVVLVLWGVQQRPTDDILPVLAMFAAAGIRIMPSAARIVAAASNVRESRGPLENILRDFRNFQPAEAAPATGSGFRFRQSLVAEGVGFRYDGAAVDSLDGIDLSIAKGESVAFIGTTGAGKTTLVDILTGLLAPTRGRVLVDGISLPEVAYDLQRSVGYVPQTIVLTDESLRHNIAFGLPAAEIDDDRVWRAARLAQIDDFIRSLPDGLDTEVGERGVRISGGQRQRIGIARALYHDPDILVMDEATSALDVVTEHQFVEAINAVRGDKTVIVIAHRLSTVRKCDRVVLLDQGRLVGTGLFDELAATHPRLSEMVSIDQDTRS